MDESTYRGSLSFETFKSLVADETQTKAVNVAGFKEWPYQPALDKLEEIANADDPAAHADPSDV